MRYVFCTGEHSKTFRIEGRVYARLLLASMPPDTCLAACGLWQVTPIDGLFNAAPLYALEVDTEEALEEFKEIVRDLAGEAAKRYERHNWLEGLRRGRGGGRRKAPCIQHLASAQ